MPPWRRRISGIKLPMPPPGAVVDGARAWSYGHTTGLARAWSRPHARTPTPTRRPRMAKDALVNDTLAAKFATEKDSPYTRWVADEGLDIIAAHWVPDL